MLSLVSTLDVTQLSVSFEVLCTSNDATSIYVHVYISVGRLHYYHRHHWVTRRESIYPPILAVSDFDPLSVVSELWGFLCCQNRQSLPPRSAAQRSRFDGKMSSKDSSMLHKSERGRLRASFLSYDIYSSVQIQT